MIYYISDLHLFHDKIIKKYNRPFSSIEEMHDCIIKNWRNTVKKMTLYMYWEIWECIMHMRLRILSVLYQETKY